MNKKILRRASIVCLALTMLVTGVFAAIQLSNNITASWTVGVDSSQLLLTWTSGAPTGTLYRGVWYQESIRLQNTGLATYDLVTVKFTIDTLGGSGEVLPDNCLAIEYNDGTSWLDMTGVISDWGINKISGYFGPVGGFPVAPDYDETTQFRIMFDGDAPLTTYSFDAWVETV